MTRNAIAVRRIYGEVSALAAIIAALLAFPAWSVTFAVDPATDVSVVHRAKDGNGSVLVLVDKAANVTMSASSSPTAKNITVSGNGVVKQRVDCKTPCPGKVVVQVDKSSTVTIAQPAPAPTASDFATRCAAPGVVRCFGFESAAELRGPLEPNGMDPTYFVQPGDKTTPTLDTTVKASGNSSLRFDIPSQSGSNAAGWFYANFADDLSVQFGENSEFFVQWRQSVSQSFATTFFTEDWGDGKVHPQGGIKSIIVTAGDQPTRTFASCEAIGIVITTYYQVMPRIPVGYDSCVGSASHGPYSGFYESVPPGPVDWKLQNGPTSNCTYSANQGATSNAGCWTWKPDEWMTFELRLKMGPRNLSTGEWDNSEVQMWAAHEGADPALILDWHPGISGYFALTAGSPTENQRFGKVWLLPYMTNKDYTQVHPLAQTWVDDLIISRTLVPYPGGKTPVLPRQ